MDKLLEIIQTILLLILMLFGGGEDTQQPITTPDGSQIEVHFIDVGQADAALVICDEEAMLIDAGNVGDSQLVYTYLADREIDYLKYAVVTHAHEDHVGGMSGALEYAYAETVFCPVTQYDSKAFSNFVKAVEKQGNTITVPQAVVQRWRSCTAIPMRKTPTTPALCCALSTVIPPSCSQGMRSLR